MNENNLMSARDAWQYRGQARPAEAIEPGSGQESVWDYPRPPVIVDDSRLVQIKLNEVLIAETRAAKRVLETASPPTFYIPPDSLMSNYIRPDNESSFCEWKGQAIYYSVCVGKHCISKAAWSYTDPFPPFVRIKDYLGFYPTQLACYIDGERVQAQAGGFYGGWITAEIVGPFKGESGSAGW